MLMSHYARAMFRRDPVNPNVLFAPDVARAIDQGPMLAPRVRDNNVTLDIEMLEDEELPQAAGAILARALTALQSTWPAFQLMPDSGHGWNIDPPDRPRT